MRWTQQEYDAYQARRASSRAKLEQVVRHEPVAAKAREAGHPKSVRVCIVSFRCRLIDPDNLCPKYFMDCLRYCGWIEDDSARHVTFSIYQTKVTSKDQQRTEITIT